MKITQEYLDFLNTNGVNIEPHELGNSALKREDALLAISILRNIGVPNLGGEVYLLSDEKIENDILSSASWSYSYKKEKNWEDYLKHTWRRSEEFIRSYPHQENVEPLFVLVPGEDTAESLLKKHQSPAS